METAAIVALGIVRSRLAAHQSESAHA
jgi:hypothetical protein